MFIKKIEHLADIILEADDNEIIDKDTIVYGLSITIEYVSIIITVIILGCLFSLPLQSVVFLCASSFLRPYVGGYHCEKAVFCYLMSSASVALTLIAVIVTPENYMIFLSCTALLISVPIIMRWAPVAASNKPLDNAEKEHYRRKAIIHLLIEISIIFILLISQLYSFAFVVSLEVMQCSCFLVIQKIKRGDAS